MSIATVNEARFIVAAFGDATWVKDVQAARAGTLSRGKQTEAVSLSELGVDERGPVLRAFLQQVRGGRRFFGGQSADEIAAHAARYPVFRVSLP